MAITLNGTTGISSPGGDTSTSLATTNLSYTGTLTGGTGVIAIGTNQIYKDASGNVGIGTASPSSKLSIASSNALQTAYTGQTLFALSTDSMAINLGGSIAFGGSYTGTSGTIFAAVSGRKETGTDADVAGYLAFATRAASSAPAERARITSAGALCINNTTNITNNANTFLAVKSVAATSTTRAANVLVCLASNANGADGTIQITDAVANNYYFGGYNGTAYVTTNLSGGVKLAAAATSWAADSDERIKKIKDPLTNALDKLATLRTVYGRFKTDDSEVSRVFLVAQDVQKVYPEVVDKENTDFGMLSIRYSEMVVPIIAAIKELTTRLEALEAQ